MSPREPTHDCTSIEHEDFLELVHQLTDDDLAADDPIIECGSALLSIIRYRPDDVRQIAHEKIHSFPFKDVPESWRRLYTEASLSKLQRLQHEDWSSKAVDVLDMTTILTGAPRRYHHVQALLRSLQQSHRVECHSSTSPDTMNSTSDLDHNSRVRERSSKRRKFVPTTFPTTPVIDIKLQHELSKIACPSLLVFEKRLNEDCSRTQLGTLPFIITDALAHWPAISDRNRTWSNPHNLLERTLGGRRLVPVELGRSYTDDGWGQKIMTFGQFLQDHMLQDPSDGRKIGYLAQHDLFEQIPELRSDICIPDFCYANVPEPGQSLEQANYGHSGHESDDIDREIMLNAWFGPANTTSPLHTDPHHNILAQAVGSKYIRLYAPNQTGKLYPRAKEGDVDMSNTSMVDVELAMVLFERRRLDSAAGNEVRIMEQDITLQQARADFASQFPLFPQAEFVEGVLEAGDCLFIPKGWWHYVRSLSTSCSVSFWWD